MPPKRCSSSRRRRGRWRRLRKEGTESGGRKRKAQSCPVQMCVLIGTSFFLPAYHILSHHSYQTNSRLRELLLLLLQMTRQILNFDCQNFKAEIGQTRPYPRESEREREREREEMKSLGRHQSVSAEVVAPAVSC